MNQDEIFNLAEMIEISIEDLRAEIATAERKVEELKNKLVEAIQAEQSAQRRLELYMDGASLKGDLSSSESEPDSYLDPRFYNGDDWLHSAEEEEEEEEEVELPQEIEDRKMEERAKKLMSEMKTIVEEMKEPEKPAEYPCIPKRDPRYPGKWVYELQPVDDE